MKNKLRQALLNNEVTLGTWIQIGHPAIAEILARAGFDWVCVDMEHGAIDLESMTNIFRTLHGFGCVPVARLPMNDPIWIHRALDAGARGLIIPMVNNSMCARKAIEDAKYPPWGTRGFGYSRANMHGRDFDEYIATANDEIAMIMQIEHKDAISWLGEICQVDGVDGLFIGPMDLSGSMGVPGQMAHPDVVDALEIYKRTCKKHNMAAGMHIVKPDSQSIRTNIEHGYTLLALGVDTVFLNTGGSSALACARRFV
jgi:2-dehydro-3-deoxyglucarate aldolase